MIERTTTEIERKRNRKRIRQIHRETVTECTKTSMAETDNDTTRTTPLAFLA